ncbi:enoyl-CoA hydratase-related protein [Cognatishimia activa]|uniref:Carnitinyl-CoA dehydratase n=1 Tax=Cognatishimia activa TaxID=1715691 RepID=A0A0P1ISR1_9RHOB|nr:enoyl-CoA hydratase-related protein [Cognatishimia activa]CUI30871.1 Carnitinyl-CoA dehydratase [Cognatishimia activa]CUK24849.1 Carnitinyl-CoA dehydratase [Cognatishimia activa]
MQNDNGPVLVEVSQGIGTLTLNRPKQRNAVNPALCDAMRSALGQLENDPNVRVIILKGAGPVFCAGMDLAAFQNGEGERILFGPGGFAGFVRRARRKPVIASVQGAALAGGFELMLACDLVVAETGAVFGLPEPKLGLIAGGGGALRLAARLPRVLANEILLTGGQFSADQMLAWGLINKVAHKDALTETTEHLARQIAANSAQSTEDTLRIANAAALDHEKLPWELNDTLLKDRFKSTDAKEGTSAFLEKRAPNWTT